MRSYVSGIPIVNINTTLEAREDLPFLVRTLRGTMHIELLKTLYGH